jgi:hypothetical protein
MVILENRDKVFIIGAHKTGTTSLDRSLQILGYNTYPTWLSYKENGLIEDFKNENCEVIFDLLTQYDAFNDSPWNHGDFYKELDKKFENSKFILSIRESNSWLGSLIRWDAKGNFRERHWYRDLSITCFGMESYLDDLETLVKKYEARNLEIIEYFNSRENFLIMDLEKGDSWEKLCSFLNCPVPDVEFPHINTTK